MVKRKKGVMAKIAAAERASKEFKAAAKTMLAEGARRMNEGIAHQRAGVKAQEQENARAVAKLNIGTRQIVSSSKQMRAMMQKEAKDLVEAGVRELKAGVHEIEKGISTVSASIRTQAKENNAYIKDFYHG